MYIEHWIIAGLSILFAPGVFLFFLVIVLAAFRKSTGLTKLYTRILLLVFEWGKQRIRIHEEALFKNGDLTPEDDPAPNEEFDRTVKSDGVEEIHSNGLEVRNIANHTSENHLNENHLTKIPGMGPESLPVDYERTLEDMEYGFKLTDAMYFCKKGMEAIVEDAVTQRFDAAELPSWNLLTRTNTHYEFISWRLTFLWGMGCILRLFILFPFRISLTLFSIGLMVAGTATIGFMSESRLKRKCNYWLSITCFRIISRAFSSVITFHNRENRAKGGGICVANHTSPIDIIILGCDNCYAMVGQSQGGFFGFMEKAMARSEHHIWFHRTEMKDRLAVTRRLREHVEDTNKLPILIFPEGTCINNTSIMMFKKGSFEVGGVIYPVAIKYDSRFADPFWNSSHHSLSRHLLNILTSWALVCDVWYLPPQYKRPDETVIQFTNRVKALIAKQGGLVDLDWDGQLKREQPKESFLQKEQEEYSRRIKGE